MAPRPAESIVYGVHAVDALLERDPAGVLEIWVQTSRRDGRLAHALAIAGRHGIAVHRVARSTLDRHAEGGRHQGIAVRYRGRAAALAPSLEGLLASAPAPALVLALDGVEDPHNLGACLRCADAAGAAGVVVPRSRGADLTPAARKVAAGAAEAVALVRVANLAEALAAAGGAGLAVVGAAGDAEAALHEVDLTGPLVLVLGAEDRGLRRLTRARCHRLARIPMAGTVASLNVSVAAGICLYEARRQRALAGR